MYTPMPTPEQLAKLPKWAQEYIKHLETVRTINERVIDSASADGAVAPTASTAAGEENYVGVVMEVAATTEYGIVWLQIS